MADQVSLARERTNRRLSAAWKWVAASLLAFGVFGSYGLWRLDEQQRQQCAAIDELVRQLGVEFQADQETIDSFINRHHAAVEAC